MAFVPLALMAVGTAVSVAGSLSQANAARAAGDYNATLAETNASLSRVQAAEQARRYGVSARKQLGAMRAAYGASGVTMQGSPMDVLGESAYTAALDSLTIRQGGEANASAYESQAVLDRLQGKSQQQGGYYSAASELLKGGYQTYSMSRM